MNSRICRYSFVIWTQSCHSSSSSFVFAIIWDYWNSLLFFASVESFWCWPYLFLLSIPYFFGLISSLFRSDCSRRVPVWFVAFSGPITDLWTPRLKHYRACAFSGPTYPLCTFSNLMLDSVVSSFSMPPWRLWPSWEFSQLLLVGNQ